MFSEYGENKDYVRASSELYRESFLAESLFIALILSSVSQAEAVHS